MRRWMELPSIFSDMQVWGSHAGAFSYVISCDRTAGDDVYSFRFAASAAPFGKTPFDMGRIDLGVFDTFGKAEQACMQHAKQSRGRKNL